MRSLKGIFLLVFIMGISFVLLSGGKISHAPVSEKPFPDQVSDSVLFRYSPVLTPEQALHTFQLEKGFRMELVASEPLIQDPVAMDFDEKGRLWVVEMQSFMSDIAGSEDQKPTGRIVILEDRNQDGRMDSARVFLDNLVLPRAITIVNNGVLFAEPPRLWFVENLQDTPGQKTLVDSAYAMGGNVEHQPNGLLRGMDNWYYNAKSRARYKWQAGQWIKEETEARGQWGITKDNYGRLFYNTNSSQLRGDLLPPNMLKRHPDISPGEGINRVIAKDQRVFPARPTPGVNRGYQEGILDEEQRLVKFTAACGPVIYRGQQFPEAYAGNAFVCEPAANLVKRNILTQDGVYVEARQAYDDREFLVSRDERFRPVNLYNAPDGSLYLVDMYRGIIQDKHFLTDYLRGQIRSRNLEKPLGYGRIYRIVYDGNWYQNLVHKLTGHPQPALNKATDRELLRFLAHPNGWWRDQAQRLLVERNRQEVVPELARLLKGENAQGVMHALWTLEGLGAYAPDIIRPAFGSRDPEVVATAIRVADRNANNGQFATTLQLYENALANQDQQVQLQLALSLGEFIGKGSDQAMHLLKTLTLQQEADALMQKAIVSSVYGKENQLHALITEEAPDKSHMVSFLKEVKTRSSELKNALNGKELTKAEREQFVLGKALYATTCAGCHQDNGEGLVPIAPPLNGSEWVTGPDERLIQITLNGLQGPVTVKGKVYQEPEVQPLMPGLKDNPEFTDEKLAAVLTYIRKAWGNGAEPVEAAKVKESRERTKSRKHPFTEAELLQ